MSSSENQAKIAERQKKNMKRRSSVDRLKFILIIFAMIYTCGCPGTNGNFVEIALGFSVPAFFIISGYFVLRDDEDRSNRILRTIKRTAIAFIIMAVMTFVTNMILMGEGFAEAVARKRFWFDLVVLDRWDLDISFAVWYVQALLYSYIFIYIIEKIGLLKIDWLFVLLGLAFGAVAGEFAGIVGFNFLGTTYIGGSFITRGIPYILLGGIIHKNVRKLRKIHRWQYALIFVLGIVAAICEYYALTMTENMVYFGHLIGMSISAFAICTFVFVKREKENNTIISDNVFRYSPIISYYIIQFVYIAVTLAVVDNSEFDSRLEFNGLIASVISIAIAVFVCLFVTVIQRNISDAIARKHYKEKREAEKQAAPAQAAEGQAEKNDAEK